MLRYATLRKKPNDLLALTGLARREFDELLPMFERVLAKALPQRRQRRQLALGGGRKPVLATAADQLHFIFSSHEDLSPAGGAGTLVWDEPAEC